MAVKIASLLPILIQKERIFLQEKDAAVCYWQARLESFVVFAEKDVKQRQIISGFAIDVEKNGKFNKMGQTLD